jgi:hypothetical protein
VYALAIWYGQTPTPKTVVWVADRSMVLQNLTTASLSLSAAGNLEVHSSDSSPQLVWSSNTTTVRGLKKTSLHHDVSSTYSAKS